MSIMVYFLSIEALSVCQKAAQAKGKDQQADIDCAKYAAAMRSDCWPCICQIAQDNDIPIKGCSSINQI